VDFPLRLCSVFPILRVYCRQVRGGARVFLGGYFGSFSEFLFAFVLSAVCATVGEEVRW